MTDGVDSAECGRATPQPAPGEFADLSLSEALEVEGAIQDAHSRCPLCGESYQEVGIYNGGSVQFIHDSNGVINNGCTAEIREEILEVLPYDVE